jgi:hypothetical protein
LELRLPSSAKDFCFGAAATGRLIPSHSAPRNRNPTRCRLAAWPTLSPAIRAGILAMVRASG